MTKQNPTTLIPDQLLNVDELTSAGRELASAMAAVDAAREGSRAARAAVEAAPDADKHAMRQAVERGEDSPPPTVGLRKHEADEARRRLDAAYEVASSAAHKVRLALVANRAELDAIERPRVESAASEIVSALDALGSKLDDLAAEVGIRRGIFAATTDRQPTAAEERSRMLGRTPAPNLPSFEPVRIDPAPLAAIRAIVEELTAQPTPARDRAIEQRKLRQEREAKARARAAV